MKEEQKFPIYTFSARWSNDGVWDEKYPNWHKGLSEGRVWNSSSFSKMFKEEQTQEQLDAIAQDWWKRMIEEKNKEGKHPIINPELEYLKAEFKENEVWVLTWFQHETIDVGQTDKEALESFQNYVDRVQKRNKEIDWEFGDDYNEKYKHGYKTLMGAEDRWRWRGANADGNFSEDAPAPCRCKFCKEQGVIRIGH